jgi:Chlorite dismutase
VPPPLLVVFAGGAHGAWRVVSIAPVAGPALARVERVAVTEGGAGAPPPGAAWVLRGVTSNARYTTRAEHTALAAVQPPLGRAEATRAALIPVRKSAAWWALAQDERRAIVEERSHHIGLGLEHLPAVARRLHHGRDLGEPFDFLTWFEYAPSHAAAFEELVAALRTTEEWRYVEREVDVRLERAAGSSASEATTASAAPRSPAA